MKDMTGDREKRELSYAQREEKRKEGRGIKRTAESISSDVEEFLRNGGQVDSLPSPDFLAPRRAHWKLQ